MLSGYIIYLNEYIYIDKYYMIRTRTFNYIAKDVKIQVIVINYDIIVWLAWIGYVVDASDSRFQ